MPVEGITGVGEFLGVKVPIPLSLLPFETGDTGLGVEDCPSDDFAGVLNVLPGVSVFARCFVLGQSRCTVNRTCRGVTFRPAGC